jgi:hypothetical protein
MSFSMPRPNNDDQGPRELAVSGHDGLRPISTQPDPNERVTAYIYRMDDGPLGELLDREDEECAVPTGQRLRGVKELRGARPGKRFSR